jgi:hypothetical protein
MRARIATKHPPGEGPDGWRNIRDRVTPFLVARPEFVHGWWFEDDYLKAVSITVWSDEDLEAHEAALRSVPLLPGMDRSRIHPPDTRAFADVLTTWALSRSGAVAARMASFDPSENASELEWVRDHLLPALREVDDFRTLLLAREAGSNQILSVSLWASESSARETGPLAVAEAGRRAGRTMPRPRAVEQFQIVHEAIGSRVGHLIDRPVPGDAP